jgi:glycerate kinase
MAAASGLPLLAAHDRNPLVTSTHGTGELVRRALDRGARRVLLGIGGSATNDGGTGLARALGWRFLDRSGRDLPAGGDALRRLARIDGSGADSRVRTVVIDVACDVNNPLCGARGASAVYGPQKGATAAGVRRLDAGLARLADVVQEQLGLDLAEVPGAGAAGGLGFGLMVFCGGRLRRGVECVAAAVALERRLRGCDLVITGEGRVDGQTVNGKTPVGVAAVAQRLGIPAIAICGCTGPGFEAVHTAGLAAVFAAGGDAAGADFVSGAADRLSRCAGEVGRLWALAATHDRARKG